MFTDILYAIDDGVANLTLNRPEVMNAVRPHMNREVAEVLADVRTNDSVRCLILTGAGRGFCAGDDFREVFLREEDSQERTTRRLGRLREGSGWATALFAIEKPTIAAINGPAVGYGMELALFCDIRYASTEAKLGSFFVRRGVLGSIGGTFILRQLVGLSKALELTLTGDLIDAQAALQIGLVSKVCAPGELMSEVRALANRLAAGPPMAQRAIKRSFHRSFELDWRSLEEYQAGLGDVLWETEDHREGVAAFVEKREPVFRGC